MPGRYVFFLSASSATIAGKSRRNATLASHGSSVTAANSAPRSEQVMATVAVCSAAACGSTGDQPVVLLPRLARSLGRRASTDANRISHLQKRTARDAVACEHAIPGWLAWTGADVEGASLRAAQDAKAEG